WESRASRDLPLRWISEPIECVDQAVYGAVPDDQTVDAVGDHRTLRRRVADDHGFAQRPRLERRDPERLGLGRRGEHVAVAEEIGLLLVREIGEEPYARAQVRRQRRDEPLGCRSERRARPADRKARVGSALAQRRKGADQRVDALVTALLADVSDQVGPAIDPMGGPEGTRRRAKLVAIDSMG